MFDADQLLNNYAAPSGIDATLLQHCTQKMDKKTGAEAPVLFPTD